MSRSLFRVAGLCGLVLAGSGRVVAAQQLTDLLGQTVVSVRFEVEGRPETSAAVAGLSDVRVGQPLRQDDVRATIAHLDSLGRYDDVVSVATPVPGGVDLLFRLVPRHPISRLDVTGETGISPGALKNLLLQRYGGVPSGIRSADVESTAEQFLQDEGYLQATVTARTELVHNPDTATLILQVAAGAQTRIAHTEVRGSSPLSAEEVIHRTRSSPGEPYRRKDIESELTSLEDTLRGRGFYEAQIALDPTQTDAGMDLTINVVTGPRVELRVTPEGSLPGGIDDLIPIRRLGAADQDLLEDARARIERLLRADGYWKASAPFTRNLREDGQLLVITFTVTRGPRYFVDHVEWPRNLTLSEVSLREQVNIRDGDVFNEDRFQTGLAGVIAEYIRQGYYQATAQPAYEELPDTAPGDRARVILHPNITEGPRGQIHEVTFAFTGAHQFSEATLRQAMQLSIGRPYVALQVAQDRAALIALYRNNGFRSVFLDIAAVPDKTTGRDVTLNVSVNEGRRVVIGEITIVGNQRVSERSILEELRLKPGQPAGDSVLNDAQRRLIDTGNFRRVTLAAPDEVAGELETHLIVTVVESPATTIGYGAGLEGGRYVRTAQDLSLEDYLGFSPRGSFQIGRRSLGGRNRSVDFFSRVALSQRQDPGNPETDGRGYGFTEYRVSGSYRERHPWQSDADLIVSTTFEQAKRTNFNFLRKGVTGELVKPVRPGVTVSGRYALSQTKLFDQRITDPKDQSTIDRLFPQVRLSLFSGALSWDRRDSVVTTTRGTFVTAEGEVAARAIGSEVGYAKIFLQGSAFRAVDASRRTILAGRMELGMAHGFPRVAIDYTADGTPIPRIVQDLPASQRFYAGGGTTVRGFQQDRLGVPEILSSDGLSNGGNGLVIMNGELRRLLVHKLTGVGFADVGNVFASASSLDFTRLRTAVGVGMRYDSPIGPIRFDVGFKVHPQIVGGQRERSWEYHLSIGETF